MSGALIAASGIEYPRVNLSGTSGSPNTDTDFGVGVPAEAGWYFLATGDCTKYTGNAHNKPEWFGKVSGSSHSAPDKTYYIRATVVDVSPNEGDVLNTWLSLATGRSWRWSEPVGFGFNIGTIKVEIATDSGGTNIIATGYYKGSATTEL